MRSVVRRGDHAERVARAVRIESLTNLLLSFEMALRDAVKSAMGARAFSGGLYDFLYGKGSEEQRFTRWCEAVSTLPRRQTRVLTWPVLTVFGFLAAPERHVFLKPNVTRIAATAFGYHFAYASAPNWQTYQSLLGFARRSDARHTQP